MAIFNQVSPSKSRGGFADGNREIISGLVVPGTSTETVNARVGSTYDLVDNAGNSSSWIKKIAGAGAANWTRMADVSDIASQASSTSWRQPVVALDTVLATAAAAVTAMNVAGTLDGVTVAAGDHVLLTNTAAGLYVVGGVSGTWTLTAVTPSASAGDNIEVINGTHGRQLWNYNGTAWGWFGQNSSSEEAALRQFVGKSVAGVVATAYTSSFYVTGGDSLIIAIGKMDTALDAVHTTAINAGTTANSAQATATSLINGTGLNANGTMTLTAGNFITNASTSLYAAIVELDTKVQASITALQNQLNTTVVKTSATGVSVSVLDSVLVNNVRLVSWLLSVYDTVTGSVFSATVRASHNGTSVIDATAREWDATGEFEMGTEIAGLSLDVVLSGAGASQALGLTISATNACDMVATRLSA